MGASKFIFSPHRRTVSFDIGTLSITILAFIGLVIFDGRIPVLRKDRRMQHISSQPPVTVQPVTIPEHVPIPGHVDLSGPVVLTLHYKAPRWDTACVVHNCVQAKLANQRMIVHTMNTSEPYCSVCQCEKYQEINCPPANTTSGSINHCEKLSFLSIHVPKHREVIYLDSDAIVLRKEFFPMLKARSRAHDFLAAYGHDSYRAPRHYGYFNSGVMFMRAIAGADFNQLIPRMYKYETGFDQSIITGWIFDHYRNWDSLSWKWHCRWLQSMNIDTPINQCLTVHDRKEAPIILKQLNYQLLTQDDIKR